MLIFLIPPPPPSPVLNNIPPPSFVLNNIAAVPGLPPVSNPNLSSAIDDDIVVALLHAFALMEKMSGSQRDMLDIVAYGRDLYCKGDPDKLSKWPVSWASCMKILVDAGYKEPT